MRTIRRLGIAGAVILALLGLAALPASAATTASEFTCVFDKQIDPSLPGLRVDVCLERTAAPGLQVHAIAWVENGTSQFVSTQLITSVQDKGGAICWKQTQWPGTTRACQSSWYWDFDMRQDDRAVASIVWWPPGQSGKSTVVQSPGG